MKSPNPSASPLPVADSNQPARPGLGAPDENAVWIPLLAYAARTKNATDKGFGERIVRFMNSSG